MKFLNRGKHITIQGVKPGNLSLQKLSADKLVKWNASNDIWAYAIVKVLSDQEASSLSEVVQDVLKEF